MDNFSWANNNVHKQSSIPEQSTITKLILAYIRNIFLIKTSRNPLLDYNNIFQFLITPSGFEQCVDKPNIFRDRLRQPGKLLFISTQLNT